MDLSDEEEQLRMEQWVEQQVIEAAEAARDSALAKEAKAAAPMENAYMQGADKWRVSEDVRKKIEAIKCSVRKERTDKVPKSVNAKNHERKVSETTSSESDSDPFDRVPRIKKTHMCEDGGSRVVSSTHRPHICPTELGSARNMCAVRASNVRSFR